MNRRNRKRPALQKEKISIIAASVFVLSALTLAGVYMAAREDGESEDNKIDFAKLEQQQNMVADEEEAAPKVDDSQSVSGKADMGKTPTNRYADARFTRETDDTNDLSDNNDMDIDPEYTEVNSGQVTNTPLEGTDKAAVFMNEEENAAEGVVAEQEEPLPQLSFSDDDTLQLPVVGAVLLNYSMDKAVYHGTMQQYRYNPALVIAATEGEIVTAAADGIVTKVYSDAQTGNTISFDLGNGYELTYGQLADITLAEGDVVKAGDKVGTIAKPTIYYTQEGTNIYIKLTKDGVPTNPLEKVNQ